VAADWIKMRTDLQSHPKIVRILSATRTDKFRVIGGLHAVWSVFDAHSVDGSLHGYTPDLLDHVIGWEGFARALESVGWLAFDGLETLTLPEFETHNGQSAKRRAEDQKRKKNIRKASDICPQPVQNSADKKRTREEKRREDIKDTPIVPENGDPLTDLVIREYHAALPKCAAVATRTPKRLKRIQLADKLARQLCDQQGWKYEPTAFWSAYFSECTADPWLRGDVPNPKNIRWRQNLDVLIAEDRFAGVMDRAIETMRNSA
jgi:hypothetical protein